MISGGYYRALGWTSAPLTPKHSELESHEAPAIFFLSLKKIILWEFYTWIPWNMMSSILPLFFLTPYFPSYFYIQRKRVANIFWPENIYTYKIHRWGFFFFFLSFCLSILGFVLFDCPSFQWIYLHKSNKVRCKLHLYGKAL